MLFNPELAEGKSLNRSCTVVYLNQILQLSNLVLTFWRISLTLFGKITVFKTLDVLFFKNCSQSNIFFSVFTKNFRQTIKHYV